MRSRRLQLLLVTALSLSIAGCASSRRRRRRGRPPGPPPPTAQQPESTGDGDALWFGAEGSPKKRDRRKKKKTYATERRVLPPSKRTIVVDKNSPIAMNLAAPSMESRDWVFIDSFKLAGPWYSLDRKGKRDTDLVRTDGNGWVNALNYGQQAAAKVPTLSGGRMVVRYKGRGIVSVRGARTLGAGDGRIVIQAKPYSQITVVVESTNVSDNVRDIRVVPEALEGELGRASFHPLFLRRLAKFSVIRFTDWGKVGTTKIAEWNDRTAWTAARQTGKNGVAYEYMVELANTLGADAWISVPFAANDAYIEQLAAFVRANLDPDLKVYVEYATEVWRTGTPAHEYARREGQFANLSRKPNDARLFFQSRRSSDVFEVFGRVFADEPRVVRVISSRLGDAAAHERLLGFERAADQTDLLAIDVRVGRELGTAATASQIEDGDVSSLMERLIELVPTTLANVRKSASIADRYRVGLAAYSGGQDLRTDPTLAGNQRIQQMFDAANRDRRMKDVYVGLLEGWRRHGGELFVHASFATKFGYGGRDGSIEYIDQPRRVTPKHDALLTFAENNPRWWDDAPKGAVASRPPPPPPPPGGGDIAPPPPPPPPGGGGYDRPPIGEQTEVVSNTGVWTAGSVAASGIALGWLCTGLYLSAAGDRDVLIAAELNPSDGAPARDLDNSAYRASIGTTLGFSLALAGMGTAFVMSLVSDLPVEDAAEPAMWLSGATSIVSAIAGTAFLLAANNTASQRDELLAANPSPTNSAPIRTLDNEGFRWGLASFGAYSLATVSAAAAIWLFIAEPESPSGDYYLDTYYQEGVKISPGGMVYRW